MADDKPASWQQGYRHDHRPNAIEPEPVRRAAKMRTREEILKAHDTVGRIIGMKRREHDFDKYSANYAHISGIMRTLCWVLDHQNSDDFTRLIDELAA